MTYNIEELFEIAFEKVNTMVYNDKLIDTIRIAKIVLHRDRHNFKTICTNIRLGEAHIFFESYVHMMKFTRSLNVKDVPVLPVELLVYGFRLNCYEPLKNLKERYIEEKDMFMPDNKEHIGLAVNKYGCCLFAYNSVDLGYTE